MTAREAEVTHCMGVRGIGFRLGSTPLDMSELIAYMSGTHTLIASEAMPFCGYRRLLTFKDNAGLNHVYYFVKD